MQKNLLLSQQELITDINTAEIYLTFYIDNKLFAIPSKYIIEILNVQKITYMPKLPHYVSGITNIRGKIVPLIDLRLRLNLEAAPYTNQTCVIYSEINEFHVGYIVDNVNDIAHIFEDQIGEPPKGGSSTPGYIKGTVMLNNKIAFILDIEYLISQDKDIV